MNISARVRRFVGLAWLLFAFIGIVALTVYTSEMSGPVNAVFSATLGVLGVVFSLRVFQTLYSNRADNLLEPAINTAVTSILESASFRSALHTALPKGKEDPKYGFDYIPFLLHSLDERRNRSAAAASGFLLATVSLGILFTIGLGYFGYLVVNEATVGTGRLLEETRNEMNKLREAVAETLPDLGQSREFREGLLPVLDRLRRSPASTGIAEKKRRVDAAIDRLKEVRNRPSLDELSKLVFEGGQEIRNGQAWVDARFAIEAFRSSREGILSVLRERSERFGSILSRLEVSSREPEARTAELLKRLAVGLVVGSFFLAVLRYLAGLYRDQERKTVAAEQAELAIRKFYVAFRCAGDSPQQQRAVLSAFLTETSAGTVSRDEGDHSKPVDDVLKELLAVIAKKL